jgi:cation:H+ antiporter
LALTFVAFVAGALVSLATSWVLVTRIERIGERLALSEALLGLLAALAADAPEATSSISALAQHQRALGSGVIIGSNVFNLAALLGVGAIVAGTIALHRKVVVLGGVVALWIAVCCAATATGFLPIIAGLVLASAMLIAYVIVLGVRRDVLARIPLPGNFVSWLSSAVDEEELELKEAIHPARGRPIDAVVACVALIIVVLSSVAMERSAATLGQHFHIADAVIGGLVLAAVTSLPNAVAAVHLARRGRGAASLSTALSSNNLNVVVGLFIPSALLGVAAPSLVGNLTAFWYVAMTVLVLVLAYAKGRIDRRSGWLIVSSYMAFVVCVVLAA